MYVLQWYFSSYYVKKCVTTLQLSVIYVKQCQCAPRKMILEYCIFVICLPVPEYMAIPVPSICTKVMAIKLFIIALL